MHANEHRAQKSYQTVTSWLKFHMHMDSLPCMFNLNHILVCVSLPTINKFIQAVKKWKNGRLIVYSSSFHLAPLNYEQSAWLKNGHGSQNLYTLVHVQTPAIVSLSRLLMLTTIILSTMGILHKRCGQVNLYEICTGHTCICKLSPDPRRLGPGRLIWLRGGEGENDY